MMRYKSFFIVIAISVFAIMLNLSQVSVNAFVGI